MKRATAAWAVILQLQLVLLHPGESTFITNVSVNDIPSGWLEDKSPNSGIQSPTPASVVMNLVNRHKTASISNIWSPQRRVKLQNTIKTLDSSTAQPRLVAQRIVHSRPVASLEDFSVELPRQQLPKSSTSPNPRTVAPDTTGLWPLLSKHGTTVPAVIRTSDEYMEADNVDEAVAVVIPDVVYADHTTEPALIDEEFDLLQLIDDLPDIGSSASVESMLYSAEQIASATSTEPSLASPIATHHSPATTTVAIYPTSETFDLNADDPFRSSSESFELSENDDNAYIKAKRAIGNEQILPKGKIVRPATPATTKPKKKPSLAEMLQNESSAERAERVQKGIQRLMHFITIVGHVDSYLTKRFRTGVKKMARLYDSTEDAHPRRHPPRHRRRIGF